MGYELGSQTIFNQKENDITCIIKGEFDSETIRLTLDKYIEKYVLCKSCGLPEIFLVVTKGKVIKSKCNSCGNINILDNKHKLATYIVKNPPKNQTEIKGGKDKDVDADKKKKKKKKKKKAKLDSEDQARLEQYKNQVKNVKAEDFGVGSELLTGITSVLKTLFEKLLDNTDDLAEDDDAVDAIYKKLKGLKLDKKLKDRFDYILFNVVFDQNISSKTQISQRGQFFRKLFDRAKRGKFLEYAVLLNVQYFVHDKYKEEIDTKLTSAVLLQFNQSGILEDDFLVKWKEGELDEILNQHFMFEEDNYEDYKTSCKDFLEWVARDDSDDDDGDDDSSGSSSDSDSGEDEE